MPKLTPLTEDGTRTLSPQSEGSVALSPRAEGSRSLSAWPELVFHWQYLWPSSTTYPSSSTWPGTYGNEIGYRLFPRSEDSKTLTPLQEA